MAWDGWQEGTAGTKDERPRCPDCNRVLVNASGHEDGAQKVELVCMVCQAEEFGKSGQTQSATQELTLAWAG